LPRVYNAGEKLDENTFMSLLGAVNPVVIGKVAVPENPPWPYELLFGREKLGQPV
jgi:hypothetical protein